MIERSKPMARFSDEHKATNESQTLALFLRFLEDEVGQAVYDEIRFRERPDAVLRRIRDNTEVGAEITRVVLSEDAAAQRATRQMGQRFVERLRSASPGGYIELQTGRFPDLSRSGQEELFAALDAEILRAGGAGPFIARLRDGIWEWNVTRFRFGINDKEKWTTRANVDRSPLHTKIKNEQLDALVLERLHAKAKSAPQYPWSGPLILLVRNTYQAFTPAEATLAEATSLMGGIFQEAWLVNHLEGVRDLSPPKPRLVRLA